MVTNFYTNVCNIGNKIYLTGYGNGKKYREEIEYQPSIYLPGPGEYKTIYDESCYQKKFDSIRDCRQYLKEREGMANFQFYGLTNYIYPFLNEEFPGEVKYHFPTISVVYIDIEVKSTDGMPDPVKADQEITAITLVKDDKIVLFGVKYYKPKLPNVEYILCQDEADLLNKLLVVWNDESISPDIVSHWNGDWFDMPYLINRIKNVLGEKAMKRLSPWGVIQERDIVRAKTNTSKDAEDRTDSIHDIFGIASVDYLQLYKKFAGSNKESYRLDNIAFAELKERKLDYSEFDGLDDLYEKDPERFYDYNIHDAVLVQKLENRRGFIKLLVSIAYKAKINYMDAFTSIRPWDVLIHNHLLAKKVVVPQTERSEKRELVGAYVHEPKVGAYNWVVSEDFKSLYPSIISCFNISNDTIAQTHTDAPNIEYVLENGRFFVGMKSILEKDNLIHAANSCRYRRDIRGFIPELVERFIMDRDAIKKRMLELSRQNQEHKSKEIEVEILQLEAHADALKILANSLYGAMANRYFRFFDVYLAESVTMNGQLIIQWVMNNLNTYLNQVLKTTGQDFVVAGDTDSVMINFDPLVKKLGLGDDKTKTINFLDRLCSEKIDKFINQKVAELCDMMNTYNHAIVIKREVIADKAIWRGKKMYILNVYDKEKVRFTEPKIIVKGIEAVRSSTPMVCRDKIKECFKIMMQKSEKDLQEYIQKFYDEFMEMPFIDIAFPRGTNDLEKWYDPDLTCKKGTPIHIRGVLIYNEEIKRLKLIHKYPLIRNKDKIRFAYLKEPNPFKSHVIAVPDEGTVPPQIDFEDYIDRQTQWEKSFLSPIKSITDIIGWSTEKRNTLQRFFG